MSYVEKLMVQGFRSFGPFDEHKQIIDFAEKDKDGSTTCWPLTLILGQNGCGKTTIIECLRYATTGDRPPGADRAFVHDPKMTGSATVEAVVKLQCRGYDGKQYVIHRAMCATQKAKSITMKTLDTTISNRTDKTQTSSKCADVNNTIMSFLGVSKPILNYVIFCHQEHSNWPLEEGSGVKKKFDEIFQSDKYQDCLKRIKDVRAAHKSKEALDKQAVEFHKAHWEHAREKRDDLDKKQSEENYLVKGIQDTEEELKPLEEKWKKLSDARSNLAEKEKTLGRLEEKRNHTHEQLRKLKSKLLHVYDDLSEDGLDELYMKTEGDIEALEDKIRSRKQAFNSSRAQLDEIDSDLKLRAAKLGELSAKKKQHQEHVSTFDRLQQEISEESWWQTDDSVVEFESLSEIIATGPSKCEEHTDKVMVKLSQIVRAQDKKLRAHHMERDKALEKENQAINALNTSKALIQDKKKRFADEIADHDAEVSDIKQQLSANEEAALRLKDLQQGIEEKRNALSDAKEKGKLDDLRAQLVKRKRDRDDLEAKEAQLRREKESLDALQKVLSDLRLKEEDAKEKTVRRDRILAKRRAQMLEIFDEIPDFADLKDSFNEVSSKTSEEKAGLETRIHQKSSDRSVKKAKVKPLKDAIADKSSKVRAIDEKLEEALSSADIDLEDDLETTSRELEDARLEAQIKEANKFTFEEFLRTLDRQTVPGSSRKRSAACPTCSRDFKTASEAEDLKLDLKEQINRIPDKVRAIKAKVARLEERRDLLRSLLPEKKQAETYKLEITETKTQVRRLDSDIKSLDRDITSLESDLEKANEKHATCHEVQHDVIGMDQMHRDVTVLQERIHELRRRNTSLEGARSLEEFKAEEEQVHRKLAACRKEIEVKQKRELDVEKRILRLQEELHGLEKEQLDIAKRQNETAELEKKLRGLNELIKEKTREQSQVDQELEELDEDIDKATRTKLRVVAEQEKKCNNVNECLEQVKRKELEIKALVDQIQAYEASQNDLHLKSQKKKVTDLNTKQTDLKQKMTMLEADMERFQENLREKSAVKDDVENNREFRDSKKKLERVENEVRQCQEELQQMNQSHSTSKMNRLGSLIGEKTDQMNRRRGELDGVRSALRSIQRELEKELYKNAKEKFHKACITLRLRQHAIQDLNKYYIALDWAISKYHEERMEGINKRIKELWKKTYRGNDIDYISIKTDSSNTVSSAGADKKRTYNYRVVMYRNEVELDMRGRCSAGQRVLASLIIRLALAETFSAKCGIIALDEPTTNLDRDNIDSLAQVLADFAEEAGQMRKKNQSNFQLICITHDEDLIDSLASKVGDQMRYYYKVTRDYRGFSRIGKLDIHDRSFDRSTDYT